MAVCVSEAGEGFEEERVGEVRARVGGEGLTREMHSVLAPAFWMSGRNGGHSGSSWLAACRAGMADWQGGAWRTASTVW